MSQKPVPFSKYREVGAYHWEECDRRSPRYNPPLEARYRVLTRRVGQARRVLDIGCGDGFLIGLLNGKHERIAGIDSEFEGVALAARMLNGRQRVTLSTGSAYELPFPDRSFDLVLMADVIEHLVAPDAALREVARVLDDSGRLLLTTPKWRPDRKWDPRHDREFTVDEIQACAQPHFGKLSIRYFWPMRWYNLYDTRYGWHLVRRFARYVTNPFVEEGTQPERYGQILLVGERPMRAASS